MPTANLIRAACFALGAAVGGGAVAVGMAARRREDTVAAGEASTSIADSAYQPNNVRKSEPVVKTTPSGLPDLVNTAELMAGPAGAILKYGHPGPINDLLIRKAYVTAYDRRLRNPVWGAEHLTLSTLGRSRLNESQSDDEKGDRSKSTFREDESIPAPFRARLKDYFRSGYDRGHMVPAADAKSSQEAMDETFLLSNMAPQVGAGFNRHYWAYLEDWCRRLTGNFQDVYVFTVPLYLPKQDVDGKWKVTYEMIGNPPNVAVPTHFAKVVLTSRPSSPSKPDVLEISTGAFVLPNDVIKDDTPLESFVVPVEAVERAAGLTLFSDAVKASSKHICQTTQCKVIVRNFDDAQKQIRPPSRRSISSPN